MWVMLPGPEIGAKKVVRFLGSSGCGEGWGNRKCFPSVVASVNTAIDQSRSSGGSHRD